MVALVRIQNLLHHSIYLNTLLMKHVRCDTFSRHLSVYRTLRKTNVSVTIFVALTAALPLNRPTAPRPDLVPMQDLSEHAIARAAVVTARDEPMYGSG